MIFRSNTGWAIWKHCHRPAAWSRTRCRRLTQEKGVTLIELVVSIALATAIAAAAALTITTIFRFTRPIDAQAIALQQVQNAGSWLSRDINMSRVQLGDGNPVLLTLTQPQNDAETITVVYRKEVAPDGSYRLIREEQETGRAMVVAENVEVAIVQHTAGSSIPSYAITIVSQPRASQAKEVRRYYQATPRCPQR